MSTVITPAEATTNVGKNVERIIAARGMSQRELAERSGIHEMTISRIIRGKNEPGIGAVARIAEALDVLVDVLLRHVD